MNRRLALSLLLATAVILAILIFMNQISPLTSGIIFAVALVGFGPLSRGYHR